MAGNASRPATPNPRDPAAVADAVRDVDGVLHLATRIRSLDQIADRDAWRENDRLRADASR
jgi:hypothetical protein